MSAPVLAVPGMSGQVQSLSAVKLAKLRGQCHPLLVVLLLMLLLLPFLLLQVAPKVLSWSQLAAAAKTEVVRKVWGPDATPAYTPSFEDSTIDHFLLHPGTRTLCLVAQAVCSTLLQ